MNVQKKRRMRRWLWPLLLFVSLFFAGGCDSNEDFETFGGYETLKLSEWDDEWNQYFEGEWKEYVAFKNQKGWIKKCFTGKLGIATTKEEEYANFFPENISQDQLEEDLEIIFSGEVRAPFSSIYPLPLFLKNIQVHKNIIIE